MKSTLLLVAVLGAVLLAALAAFVIVRHHLRHPEALANGAAGPLNVNLMPLDSNPARDPNASPDAQVQNTPGGDSTAATLNESSLLVLAGKPDEAAATLTTGIQSNPNDPRLYTARAYIYSQQGRWDEARQDLTKAVDLGDKNSPTKFDLAEIDFEQKNYDAARPGFLALESDPDWGDLSSYKVFLCDLYAGHEDQATRELDAFNLAGANPSFYFANVAWNLFYHKTDDARTWLDSANRIYSSKKLFLYSYSLTNLGYLPLPPKLSQ